MIRGREYFDSVLTSYLFSSLSVIPTFSNSPFIMPTIQSLPTEVLLDIFQYLDLRSLLCAERVNRSWLFLIRNSLPIWRRQFCLMKSRESLRVWREFVKLIPRECVDVQLYRQSVVVYGLLTEALSEKIITKNRRFKKRHWVGLTST